MSHTRVIRSLVVAALLLIPAVGEAGPPLLCQPFHTGAAAVLPWGDGSSWQTPDRRYDVQRLTSDTVALLSDSSVIARMENLRRATIYAAQDARVAAELLTAILARAQAPAAGGAPNAALFDAGYLIETYKQAEGLHRRPVPTQDGYAMVQRAIALSGTNPEMEFAASLMKAGTAAADHRRRAQAGAPPGSLLAQNLAR